MYSELSAPCSVLLLGNCISQSFPRNLGYRCPRFLKVTYTGNFFSHQQFLYHLDWSIASSGLIKLTGLLLQVLVEWNPAIKKGETNNKRISIHYYQSVEFNSSSQSLDSIHSFITSVLCFVCFNHLFNSLLIVLNDAVYELMTITIRLCWGMMINDQFIHCWLISSY